MSKVALISTLKPGMKGFNVQFIVVDKVETTKTRDGQIIQVFLVADAGAAIHLSLWGAVGDAVRLGDILRLNGGWCDLHHQSLHLYIAKGGRLFRAGHFSMLFNESPNLSLHKWPLPSSSSSASSSSSSSSSASSASLPAPPHDGPSLSPLSSDYPVRSPLSLSPFPFPLSHHSFPWHIISSSIWESEVPSHRPFWCHTCSSNSKVKVKRQVFPSCLLLRSSNSSSIRILLLLNSSNSSNSRSGGDDPAQSCIV